MTSTDTLRKRPVRQQWAAIIVVLIVVGEGQFLDASPPQASSDRPAGASAKELRKAVADRHRRILLNNDGGTITHPTLKRIGRPSIQNLLDEEVTPLIGSQVDTIFYCTHCSGFGLFTHFTKVGSTFTAREGIFANNQMEALIKAGLDPLQVMVDFGKQHGIEVFWSMRMNDTHDGSRQSYGPLLFRANPLKNAHPEYLLGSAEEQPKHGAWTAVDYGRPEIRELAFRYLEEVCKNYDVDGVELDFFRHPVFFKSTARGEPATDEDRVAMTELVKRIRAMADEVGKHRGRPILIAVKSPDSVEYARAIGLEIEKWMAEDLLDLFIPAGYFQLNNWNYSVALGHKYGVKVYPSLDESRVRDTSAMQIRMKNLAYRGRAANVWTAGADGVYLFNFDAAPDSPVWNELHQLGDPKKLAKLDKDYFGSIRGIMKAAGGNLPYEPFQKIETLNPKNPKLLVPGMPITARMNVGEDLTKAGAVKLKLRLRFDPTLDSKLIQATINDQPLQLLSSDKDWLEYSLEPKKVRCGSNQVAVTLSQEAKASAKWTDLLLEVRH